MHAVRRALAEAQAERTGIPLWAVELPWPCSNEVYEHRMRAVCQRAKDEGITAIAFGDLFLEDVRSYRIRQLEGTGLAPLFPLWQIPTDRLARQMIAGGVKAKITCVDPSKLAKTFAGRDYDAKLLEDLPPEVDSCGENGEFHTFVYDAPVFTSAIGVRSRRSGRARWICICRCASRVASSAFNLTADPAGPVAVPPASSGSTKLSSPVRCGCYLGPCAASARTSDRRWADRE